MLVIEFLNITFSKTFRFSVEQFLEKSDFGWIEFDKSEPDSYQQSTSRDDIWSLTVDEQQ